jgi:co-chaperonin GroES (HSP10)
MIYKKIEMWRPQNKRVIIELTSLYDNKVSVGGHELIIDHVFRRLWNAVQEGVVISCGEGCDLKPGDTVYVHHFIIEKEKRIPVKDKEYRWLDYNQIYCRVRNGKLKTLSNFVLVEPIKYDNSKFKKETESGLILTQKSGSENVDRVGIVYSIGDGAKNAGLSVGDKILFDKNCEYEIKIQDKILYRMELRDVITIIDPDVEFTV